MDDGPLPLPDRDAIKAIVAWEPLLRRPPDELFRWEPSRTDEDGVMSLPYVEYSPAFLDFLRALSGHGFIVPFDWSAWADEGMAIQEDPSRIAVADLATVVRLFTMHVRADRFTEGHLAAVIERGWCLDLLARLRVLVEDEPTATR
jgi:hypothetical protein